MTYVYDLLMKRREAILKSLEIHEPELVRDLRDVDVAIFGVSKNAGLAIGPYTDKRQAIDAITAYLVDVGHPDTPENIVKALIDGGFAPLDRKRKPNIIDSIRYHTRHSQKLALLPPDADHAEERICLPGWNVIVKPKQKDGK
jgi:hypothetical protein